MQPSPSFSSPHKYTLVDAHHVYKSLLAAGFNEQQAEEVTNILNSIDLNHLASKQDVENSRTEFRYELSQLETRLSEKIHNAQMTIIKWLIPLMLGQVAIFGFIVKFL